MIMELNHLPFKVGHLAESKSFVVGYRSAWFRCKIKKISIRRGQIQYSLEFFDFPDEKVSWTNVYQKPPHAHSDSCGETKMQLIVRPCFPPIYRRSQMPDLYGISDVIAIVEDAWKVGDLVDWWSDDCYWSGRVSRLEGNDKVLIELPEPPIGEGKSYEALCKDLRPSLDWSLEHGWTVPISREHDSCPYSAELVWPSNQDIERKDEYTLKETTIGGASSEVWRANFSNVSPLKEMLKQGFEREEKEDEKGLPCRIGNLKSDGSIGGKPGFLDKASSSHGVKNTSVVSTKITSRKDRYSSLYSPKKMRINESRYMTSVSCSDTIESSIMELEELANKLRWLKGLLQFGFRWSNAMKPSWKFLENRGLHRQS